MGQLWSMGFYPKRDELAACHSITQATFLFLNIKLEA